MKSALFLLILLALPVPALAGAPVVGLITGSPGLGDKSFNDMAHAGVVTAQKEYGFELLVLEPGNEAQASERDLRAFLDKVDVAVLLGGQYVETAALAAKAHPDKKFLLLDAAAEGPPNLASAVFRPQEAAFLAGALAALVARSGKIGFVGGARIPAVTAFERGYRQGADRAVPGIEVLVAYASPEGDYSGFNNPDKGRALANAQYDQGADVVFAAAGRTGLGVIEAAAARDRLAVGVDADQDALAKGHVLTSVVKRLDLAANQGLKNAMAKTFAPGITSYGLTDGGVGLTGMAYVRDKVPQSVRQKIEELRQEIIAGKITVAGDQTQ